AHIERLRHQRQARHRTLGLEAHIEMAVLIAFPCIHGAAIERGRKRRRLYFGHHAAWHWLHKPLASIMVRLMAKPSRWAAVARSTRAWPASNSSAAPHFSQIRKMVERAQAPTSQAI